MPKFAVRPPVNTTVVSVREDDIGVAVALENEDMDEVLLYINEDGSITLASSDPEHWKKLGIRVGECDDRTSGPGFSYHFPMVTSEHDVNIIKNREQQGQDSE